MGQAIVVRTDYSSGEVRPLAQRAKAAGQARRRGKSRLGCQYVPDAPS